MHAIIIIITPPIVCVASVGIAFPPGLPSFSVLLSESVIELNIPFTSIYHGYSDAFHYNILVVYTCTS